MRTQDPETAYIGRITLGTDYGSGVRCKRCGGRGMWKPPGGEGKSDFERVILCLQCADEWMEDAGGPLLKKHGYVWSSKKWLAAFDEFCSTKPIAINVAQHNQEIIKTDELVHTAFPKLFSGDILR